jgi:hypothetical protein
MPGDGLTHGPPANKKAGGSDHRLSRISRHSLRNGVTAYTRPPRCPGLIATVALRITARLDPSVGRSGPRDFAVRVRHARPSWQTRPSHPRPTVRDDRPKRPSSSRQDAREAVCDLPDEASGIFATDWHDGQTPHGVHAGIACRGHFQVRCGIFGNLTLGCRVRRYPPVVRTTSWLVASEARASFQARCSEGVLFDSAPHNLSKLEADRDTQNTLPAGQAVAYPNGTISTCRD